MEIKNFEGTQVVKKTLQGMSVILSKDNVLKIITRKKREENIIHGMYTIVAMERKRKKERTSL